MVKIEQSKIAQMVEWLADLDERLLAVEGLLANGAEGELRSEIMEIIAAHTVGYGPNGLGDAADEILDLLID